MRKSTCWLVGAALLVLPLTASSQGLKPADRSPWEISGSVGYFMDYPEFGPNDSPTFFDPSESLLFGGGVNYHLSSGLFVGVDGHFVAIEIGSPVVGLVEMNTIFFSALAGYTLPVHDLVDLYGLGGPAGALWSPTDYDSELDLGAT